MTPGARLSAAIAVLDRVLAGEAAEKALTNWGRASRFAGSGDRAAVRDLVFDALRCLRSAAALGGAMTGRGLVLGRLRELGTDPAALFTGEGHAPAPLADEPGRAPQGYEAWDLPDWLGDAFRDSLGDRAEAVALALRARAPLFLRVNLRKTDLPGAQAALRSEGIETRPHPIALTALEVTEGARRVSASRGYETGLVEVQDASSQAVTQALPLSKGMKVLDFCAGGGGKTLAMAAQADVTITAHDIDAGRMRDLPGRAARAGVKVSITAPGAVRGQFDLVLVDAPCSGSGTWRRTPEAKWRLTPERLADLTTLQTQVLAQAAAHVAPGGWLAFVTCSVLRAENEKPLQDKGYSVVKSLQTLPTDGGDGFAFALLRV